MPFNVIGIIPARYGSTRFPGKPLIPILGKTLLQRTYENASLATSLERIVVATDDWRIYEHVRGFGGNVVMTSPDCPTGTDRIAEVLNKDLSLKEASVIVNIQGDEPCIDPKAIDRVAHLLLHDPHAVMSTVAVRLESEEDAYNPSVVKCIMDQNSNALYFSRALIPSNKKNEFIKNYPYLRHVGLYAYRPSFILTYQNLPLTSLQMAEDLEQLKVLENGYRIKMAIIDRVSPGVDTPEDIQKVKEWLCKQNTYLSQAESAPH